MQILLFFYVFAVAILAVLIAGCALTVAGGIGLAFCRCREAALAFLIVGLGIFGASVALAGGAEPKWPCLTQVECAANAAFAAERWPARCADPKSWSDGKWCEEAARCPPDTIPRLDLIYGHGWRLSWCEPKQSSPERTE